MSSLWRSIRVCRGMARKLPEWLLHGPCCLVTTCRDGNCRLTIPRKGPLGIISGTAYQKEHLDAEPLCDFVCFWEAGDKRYVVAVELKGTIKAQHVLRQLQAGASIAEDVISAEEVIFGPVLATSAGVHTMQLRVLRRDRITFRGRRHLTKLARCGDDLAKLIATMPAS